MEYVTTLEELEEKITDNRLQAVFLTTKNCSVCTVDKPIVEKIATKYEFPTYIAEADKSPEIIGQLNAFSAPTIILYYEGKEIHRQAKIINFQEIEKRVRQVQENS
ncbi:TPA: thioredoxin family protein [Enterococcus faecalis]